MVAGTGHDFLSRHSCSDAIFIRTSLLKNIEWDINDTKGFGHPEGNVKFGAGIVFSEAHKSAADLDRFVSSGWASTVGVVGWAIGGGHGPFAPSKGLGVDNILAAEIVTANGSLITVNATGQYSDLYWAIRGGGGSNWGIFTSITYRAHTIPDGGFTSFSGVWNGNFCKESGSLLDSLIDNYLSWTYNLDTTFGGLAIFLPIRSEDQAATCGGTWLALVLYHY